MPYDFETFCADCRDALADEHAPAARERVRRSLERLLSNDAFLTEHFGEDAPSGRHQIHRDEQADFCVLVYNTRAPMKPSLWDP